MSNTKRPNMQRQHTRSTKQKRSSELDTGLTIAVDGTPYTVREGDLTSLDVMALRRETGYSFRGLIRAFQADPDVDLIAALVWLSRRLDGERLLDFSEVAAEIGYDIELDVVRAAEEEESPEA